MIRVLCALLFRGLSRRRIILCVVGSLVIKRPAESLSEGGQPTSLIELDIPEGLFRRLPRKGIARVLGGAVDGLRGGGADGVG